MSVFSDQILEIDLLAFCGEVPPVPPETLRCLEKFQEGFMYGKEHLMAGGKFYHPGGPWVDGPQSRLENQAWRDGWNAGFGKEK